jgi:hypothetical protein
MNESQIQAEMVQAAVQAGGYAFKLSNRFKAGVADLMVQMPGPTAFIEVKYKPKAPRSGRITTFGLTMLQRIFITKVQMAGGLAGWAGVAGMGRGNYWLAVSTDPEKSDTVLMAPETVQNTFHDDVIWLRKERATPWPMAALVDRLVQISKQARKPLIETSEIKKTAIPCSNEVSR